MTPPNIEIYFQGLVDKITEDRLSFLNGVLALL